MGTQQVHVGLEVSAFDRNTEDLIVVMDYISEKDDVVDAEVVEDEVDPYAIQLSLVAETAAPGERPERNVRPPLRPRRPVVRRAAPAEPATDDDSSPLGQPSAFASDAEWRRAGRERAKRPAAKGKLQPRKRRA
ncbi:hypothetical protein [Leifsonia sp. fls2-241-R2A-40a]|uniref:hypothetical protein n=1 Tax=Leifsonia sp. fls2-241-R2A-40a TaxID=3040290 RepID=UPI00254EDDB1|nr:hypothetical protein [Leifsonia sp. fls2-241-R2A-40a]